MKKRIYCFIAISLGLLAIAPIFNLVAIINGSKPAPEKFSHWKESLYNLDFAATMMNSKLFSLGISTDPQKVIIGKDGWMFLGDSYAKTISHKRQHTPEESRAAIQSLGYSASAWNAWFHKRGAKDYLILVGPDKDSVYPDKVPDWAHHSNPTLLAEVMNTVDKRLFIYPVSALSAARNDFNFPVYYKTDTHWNLLGGAIAFESFKNSMASRHPELQWPEKATPNDVLASDRIGGDLANFLRIPQSVHDTELQLKAYQSFPFSVEQFDYATDAPIASNGSTDVSIITTPTRVYSKNALNDKRVLWLRDSYGSALAPLMAMTFKETLQIHHNRATQALLDDIMAKFKPDYVFVTNVERDVLASFLTTLPAFEVGHSRESFVASATALSPWLHHLQEKNESGLSVVDGIDPFAVFKLSNSIVPKNTNRLAFDLQCQGEEGDVPVQLYWRSNETVFMESNSLRFNARAGVNVLPLFMSLPWVSSEAVTEIRLDLDDPTRCKALSFDNVALGAAF